MIGMAIIASMLGPVAERPTGAILEVRGALFAYTDPASEPWSATPLGFPDADGVIRFKTDRLTDYRVTIALPGPDDDDDFTPDTIYQTFTMPSTRAHRIERAIELYRQAEILREQTGATIFELEAAKQRVVGEATP